MEADKKLPPEDADYHSFISDFTESHITFFDRLKDPDFYYTWALERIREFDSAVSFIDFGCGDGIMTQILLDSGVAPISIQPIDYSSKALDDLEKNLGFQIVRRSLGQISNSSYDIALALEVLEHTEKPEEVLHSLFRKCTTAVIFTVPIKDKVEDPYHKSTFDYDRVFEMCNKLSSDFQIYKISKKKRYGSRLRLFGVVLKKLN